MIIWGFISSSLSLALFHPSFRRLQKQNLESKSWSYFTPPVSRSPPHYRSRFDATTVGETVHGIAAISEGCVKQEAAELLKDGIDLVPDADKALSNLLSYPLFATLARTTNGRQPSSSPSKLRLIHLPPLRESPRPSTQQQVDRIMAKVKHNSMNAKEKEAYLQRCRNAYHNKISKGGENTSCCGKI